MAEAEIKVVIFNEEYTYDILSECFSTNERINEQELVHQYVEDSKNQIVYVNEVNFAVDEDDE